MNNDTPKIAFAYPTFPKAGMIAVGPFIPDIGIKISELPAKKSFYVSAGLILNSKRAYSFDIDVLFDKKSLVPVNVPAVDSRLLGTSVSDRDDFIATATTLLTDVGIYAEGIHTVRILLYAGEVGSQDRQIIDTYDSHFVVAKNWLQNEMTRDA